MNLYSDRALCRNSARLERRNQNFTVCRCGQSNSRRCDLKADVKPTELRRPSNVTALIYKYKLHIILQINLPLKYFFYGNGDKLWWFLLWKTIDRPKLHSKSIILLMKAEGQLKTLCDVRRKRFVTSDVNKLIMTFVWISSENKH
jgi:hypothetical protein